MTHSQSWVLAEGPSGLHLEANTGFWVLHLGLKNSACYTGQQGTAWGTETQFKAVLSPKRKQNVATSQADCPGARVLWQFAFRLHVRTLGSHPPAGVSAGRSWGPEKCSSSKRTNRVRPPCKLKAESVF